MDSSKRTVIPAENIRPPKICCETVVRYSCSRKMTLPNRDGGNLTVRGFADPFWKRTAATVCVLASAIEKPAEEMVVARVHVSLNVFSVSDPLGPRLLGE